MIQDIDPVFGFMAVGALLLLYGVYKLKRINALIKNGKRAEGSVYEFITKRDIEGNPDGHYISVGFVTADKSLIVREINVSVIPYEYKKGDIINIIYDTNNPDRIWVDEGKSPAYTYFLYLFPGLISVTIGVWMFLIK